MTTAWPTASLIHLPVHASWLSQVEIYFWILQRKAIDPNDFRDLDDRAERILDFRTAVTRPPLPWTGPTPVTTSMPSSNGSATKRHDPRRTNGGDH